MIALQEGFKGGEQLEVKGFEVRETQLDQLVVDPLLIQLQALKNILPSVKIPIDTTDGVIKEMDVRYFQLQGEWFKLARGLAEASPMVYIRSQDDGRYVEAMLSPNYDEHGETRRETVRAIPVRKTGILVNPKLWLPDANQVMAMAGGVSMEKRGVGGHADGTKDVEHGLGTMGAVSANDITIATGHIQHDIRKEGGATAHELSGGKMGTLLAPGRIEGFSGFGKPITFDGTTKDVVFMPDSFFDHPYEVFGALLKTKGMTPERFITGLGLRVLKEGGQLGQLDTFKKAMEAGVGSSNSRH